MKQQLNRTCRAASAPVLFFLLSALVQMSAAAVPIIVGTGTPESCTEATLRDAMNTAALYGSGNIRFKCGGAALKITLNEPLMPPNDTTIDGNEVITLARSFDAARLLFVQSNATVILKNLHLDGGTSPNGMIVYNAGTLTLKSSTISGDAFVGLSNSGALIVKDSVISMGDANVVFANSGMATIKGSEISGANIDQAGIGQNGGTLIIEASIVSLNITNFSNGGVENTGILTIKGSVFSNNVSRNGDGAVRNLGTLSVSDSAFFGNRGNQNSRSFCGALDNKGIATVKDSEFIDNDASDFGNGGAICNTGAITVANSTFFGNSARYGGAIANGGTLTLKDSTITGNFADIQGGGIYTYGGGTTKLMSTVVTGNIPDNIATAP